MNNDRHATAVNDAAPAPGAPVIDYGERLRLGIMVPSGNVIAEPQIHAMLPPGVAAYITRLELLGTSEAELLKMTSQVESGVKLLADARVDAIVFHCTAASTFSIGMGQEIQARIEQASGIPAISTSDAIIQALRSLRARKIVLLTPYLEAVNQRECVFLEHFGLRVIDQDGLGINTNTEMAPLAPEVWIDMAMRHRHDDADAYFVSCTAVRSAEVIARMEALLQRPVITSNQAMVWYALRKHGITDHIPGFGRLFDTPLLAASSGTGTAAASL